MESKQEAVNLLNLKEAKKSLKYNIEFLESIKRGLSSEYDVAKIKSMAAAWLIHRFIHDELVPKTEELLIQWKKEEA